ncbi:MAG: BON domain-containing protein [Gemmatimonadales bacterium]
MRHRDRLGGAEIFLWSGVGVGVGLVAGFALSEWVGGVNRLRMRGVARRIREGSPARLTTSATARSVAAALEAEPRLQGLGIQPLAVARGVVELRGWVPNRTARTLAGRTALAAPGIESVINSLLVHGEDDLRPAAGSRATDQSA